MSSRLARDSRGRLIVELTTPQLSLETGDRFLVLGNMITVSTLEEAGRFFFLETKTGRRARRSDFGPPRKWSDADRAEARRLRDEEGLSWAQIAKRVCGDKRYKQTVGVWLKKDRRKRQEPPSEAVAA